MVTIRKCLPAPIESNTGLFVKDPNVPNPRESA